PDDNTPTPPNPTAPAKTPNHPLTPPPAAPDPTQHHNNHHAPPVWNFCTDGPAHAPRYTATVHLAGHTDTATATLEDISEDRIRGRAHRGTPRAPVTTPARAGPFVDRGTHQSRQPAPD
ncbi:MAG: hypothetical protein K6T59_05870, partial [Bryobacteraceae bacterium]|nr:hypothetical protein [Bryobacteraceae bacterium]